MCLTAFFGDFLAAGFLAAGFLAAFFGVFFAAFFAAGFFFVADIKTVYRTLKSKSYCLLKNVVEKRLKSLENDVNFTIPDAIGNNNKEKFIKIVFVWFGKISIFWSFFIFGTCLSTLSDTKFNEKSDKIIRIFICSMITPQLNVQVGRNLRFLHFFCIFKTVKKRGFSHFSLILAVFSGFVIEF